MKLPKLKKVKAARLKDGDIILVASDGAFEDEAAFFTVRTVTQPKEPPARDAKPTMRNRMTIMLYSTNGRLRPLPTDDVYLQVVEEKPERKKPGRKPKVQVAKGNGAEALSA